MTTGATLNFGTGASLSFPKPVRRPPNRSGNRPPPPPRTHPKQGMAVTMKAYPGLTPKGLFNGRTIQFQCPPMEPFTITYGNDSQTYETVNSGSYSVVAANKLDTVQFKTLMVTDAGVWPWAGDPLVDVDELRDTLVHLAKTGDPFILSCVNPYAVKPEYYGTVNLTTYTHTENEPYTYYADVSFQEYRDPTVDTATTKRPGGKTWPQHHKLAAGDTLYGLARHYYGKTSYARNIAQANHIRNANFNDPIVKLGGKWKIGVGLLIPKPPANSPTRKKPLAINDG